MVNNDYLKSIEQIAAGLAHEVKNPLSLVKANIDLLELEDAAQQHSKNYSIMRREINKINELLLDFIQFAKPYEASLKKVEIKCVLAKLTDEIQSTYSKKVNLSLHCEESELYALCDENKINRVFLNIIKNAIEAVETVTGVVNISVSKYNGHIKIIFKDNGKGLDKAQLEKISSPFYTTKAGGSGLGLYISKTIINEHNGMFEIIGEPDKGCVVTVMLPILE